MLTYHNIEARRRAGTRSSPRPSTSRWRFWRRRGSTRYRAHSSSRFSKGARSTLPPKPVLITFDDGPKTAWIYADPILASATGFDAVMFTITGRVGQHQPYYLTWDEIERMHRNRPLGLRVAHEVRPSPDQGQPEHGALTGAFLTNKMWQPSRRNVEIDRPSTSGACPTISTPRSPISQRTWSTTAEDVRVSVLRELASRQRRDESSRLLERNSSARASPP